MTNFWLLSRCAALIWFIFLLFLVFYIWFWSISNCHCLLMHPILSSIFSVWFTIYFSALSRRLLSPKDEVNQVMTTVVRLEQVASSFPSLKRKQTKNVHRGLCFFSSYFACFFARSLFATVITRTALMHTLHGIMISTGWTYNGKGMVWRHFDIGRDCVSLACESNQG